MTESQQSDLHNGLTHQQTAHQQTQLRQIKFGQVQRENNSEPVAPQVHCGQDGKQPTQTQQAQTQQVLVQSADALHGTALNNEVQQKTALQANLHKHPGKRTSKATATNCTVLGAGVIGLCTAIALQRQGVQVTLVDRSGIG